MSATRPLGRKPDDRLTADRRARGRTPGHPRLYRLEKRWQAWLDVEAALAKRRRARPSSREHAACDHRGGRITKAWTAPGRTKASPAPGHTIVLAGVGIGRCESPATAWRLGALGARRRKNITQTGDLWCCARRTAFFLRLIADRDAAASHRRARRRDADGWFARTATRGAGDLRLQVAVWSTS